MMSLAMFRFVGRHAGQILSGILLAAVLAWLAGKVVPGSQLLTFIALSVSWILFAMAFILRQRYGEQDSLVVLSIETLPFVIVGITVVLLVAFFVGRHEPVAIVGPVIGILGTVACVLSYVGMIAATLRKRRLDEDLSSKPTKSSNQTLQPTAGREENYKV